MIVSNSSSPTSVGNLLWFKNGQGVVGVLGEDGVVRRYFIIPSRILESPQYIEKGDLVEFCGSTPARPGFLPLAVGVRITKKPVKTAPAVTPSNGGTRQ